MPAVVVGGLGLTAAIARPSALRLGTVIESAGLVVTTLFLVAYVAGEDDYRDNGTSRWDAYGAQHFTATAVVAGLGAIALLAAARLTRNRWLAVAGFLCAAAAAVLQFLAVFANSLN